MSSGVNGRRGAVGIARHASGIIAAAALTAALTATAAGATPAMRVIDVNEGRHLTLSVLQHGAIIVLQRSTGRVERLVGVHEGLASWVVHTTGIRGEHRLDTLSRVLRGLSHGG